jgi:cell division protein FtsB
MEEEILDIKRENYKLRKENFELIQDNVKLQEEINLLNYKMQELVVESLRVSKTHED